MTCSRLHWTTDSPSRMHGCKTPVCVNLELHSGAGDIHISWYKLDALAEGNAYKPTKEPISYRGPGGDRTHDLQTEATPTAGSCPARSLHATEICKKHNPNDMPDAAQDNCRPIWNARMSVSTPLCVNFELRLSDIHIIWFDFLALTQGNAYKSTKEPINYRGRSGNRIHNLQTEATQPAASCPARSLHATVSNMLCGYKRPMATTTKH